VPYQAGYEAVAGRAFGGLGLAVVSGIMYAELLGICCVYVVLEVRMTSLEHSDECASAWLAAACVCGHCCLLLKFCSVYAVLQRLFLSYCLQTHTPEYTPARL
jgi:hypothetical protein